MISKLNTADNTLKIIISFFILCSILAGFIGGFYVKNFQLKNLIEDTKKNTIDVNEMKSELNKFIAVFDERTKNIERDTRQIKEYLLKKAMESE